MEYRMESTRIRIEIDRCIYAKEHHRSSRYLQFPSSFIKKQLNHNPGPSALRTSSTILVYVCVALVQRIEFHINGKRKLS